MYRGFGSTVLDSVSCLEPWSRVEGPVSHYFRPRHHTQRESRVLRWTRKRREVACCSILVRRERLLSTCRRVEGVRTLVL